MNASVYALEVAELRRERDALRVELASTKLDLERAVKRAQQTISGLRRLYGEARGEFPVKATTRDA